VERLAGLREALAGAGLPHDPAMEVITDGWGPIGEALDRILATGATAVFCTMDTRSLELMEAARTRGLRIPEDLSLVSFDDVPAARLVHPPLTTVRQPAAMVGAEAVRQLVRMLGEDAAPARSVFPVELRIRESACPPRR
jgi:LacI family transcriptional regulator